MAVINEHIPTKLYTNRRNLPWFERSHRRLYRKKQRLYNKAKKSGKQHDWDNYRNFCKTVRRVLNHAKKEYVVNNLSQCIEDNPKAFWSFVKKIRQEESGVADLKVDNKIISDDQGKAEALSNQFASVFTIEDTSHIPYLGESTTPDVPQLIIGEEGVLKQIKNLKPDKAPGPDGIAPWMLHMRGEEVTPVLTDIFQISVDEGVLPRQWREANICAIFKKGAKEEPSNYRGVSVTIVVSKILEHIIHSHIIKHILNPKIS